VIAGVEDPGGAGEYVHVVDGHWDSPFEVEHGAHRFALDRVGCHGPSLRSPTRPSAARGEKVGLASLGMTERQFRFASRWAWSEPMDRYSPSPGGLVCAGMMELRGGQFRAESLEFKVKKEKCGKRIQRRDR